MKQFLQKVFRKLGILEYADYIKFILSYFSFLSRNRNFKKNNPNIVLPPHYMLFESFGKMDYASYFEKGKESADDILELLEKHHSLENINLLEWGCGPVRILRHIPEILSSKRSQVFGSDYNPETIKWNKKSFDNLNFSKNDLLPPLEYDNNFFDVIFCISVFTHLDEITELKWFNEIIRVLKPGGIFLLSIHGESSKDRLSEEEKKIFDEKGCVIRSNVTEGKRSFVSYNSEKFMRKTMLKDVQILEFIPGKTNEQDIWIIKK
ncbi:MAG: methyltransferase domain-containing protein [Candidatus Delongbacteria bacterium]|nr:methyltransferase domain-containing protein [Candidatus Delongbacteria bacterium]